MDDTSNLAFMKFGIGQPVPRNEDPMLLKGLGRYTDDVNVPGQVYAVMVRSPHAHGTIRAIDTAEAKAMPGVLGVYVWEDLAKAGIGMTKAPTMIPNRDGSPVKLKPRPALASGKVRYVGEAVACVIAATIAQAKDAAEAVVLDIDPLRAVTGIAEAIAPGAPLLHDEAPGNILLDFHYGDSAAVAAAFLASFGSMFFLTRERASRAADRLCSIRRWSRRATVRSPAPMTAASNVGSSITPRSAMTGGRR